MIQGRNILLVCNGKVIAATVNNELSLESELLPYINPYVNSNAKGFYMRRTEWSVSSESFYCRDTDLNTLFSLWSNGTGVTVYFYDNELMFLKKGTAILTSIKLDGSVGKMSRVSLSFQGCGDLQDETSTIQINWSDSKSEGVTLLYASALNKLVPMLSLQDDLYYGLITSDKRFAINTQSQNAYVVLNVTNVIAAQMIIHYAIELNNRSYYYSYYVTQNFATGTGKNYKTAIDAGTYTILLPLNNGTPSSVLSSLNVTKSPI